MIGLYPKKQDGIKSILFLMFPGHKDMVEYLISKGANVSLGYRDGMTPLHSAVSKGIFALNIIFKSINQSKCNEFLGNVEIVDILLRNCAPVNLRTKTDGKTPLHLAAMNGNFKKL